MEGRDAGEVITTPLGEMWMSDGVLVHQITHAETITEDHAADVVAAVKQLTRGEPKVAIVDITSIGYALPEARHAFAGSLDDAGEIATALIVASAASRAMARVFLALSKPARPIKVFSTFEAAMKWAKEFQAQP